MDVDTEVSESRTVIVGLGNPIMSDDAVGIVVAQKIYEQIHDHKNVDLVEAPVGGFELVDIIVGYDRAIIIDAIQTEWGHVGDHYLLDLESAQSTEQPSMTHQVGLIEGLELARRLGTKTPEYLRVYAIEADDIYTFGTEMTEAVKDAVPRIAEEIIAAEFS